MLYTPSSPKPTARWLSLPTWFRGLAIALLVLGIFFRFVNLDHKIYWGDETFTSLWISGHTQGQVYDNLYNGEVRSLEEVRDYQTIQPGTSVIETVQALAKDTPLHPPLYYGLIRLWVGVFGDSVTAIRSLSAVFGLLLLPCVYWLCLELFRSSLVAWVGVALTSVSPYHVLFSQEARQYSLWAVMLVIMSATLLRALRTQKPRDWVFYALSLSLSLYTFVLTVLVAIGHGVYVLVTQRFRINRTAIAYVLSSLGGVLLFVPWLTIILGRRTEGDWNSPTLSALLKKWVGIFSRAFFDIGLDSSNSPQEMIQVFLPVLFILVLIAYAFYVLCRKTPVRIWLFVLTFAATLPLIMSVQDAIKGGGALSTTPRYLMPLILGIQLAVAYLLATQIVFMKGKWQKFWQLTLAIVLSLGILSNVISAQAEVWWNKGGSITRDDVEMSRIINQSERPLIVSNATYWSVMAMSHLAEPDTHFQLLPGPDAFQSKGDFQNVFVYRPSPELLKNLQSNPNYKLKILYPELLWKLDKPN